MDHYNRRVPGLGAASETGVWRLLVESFLLLVVFL